jgi:N-acetylneuraminic acid mutarotase
MTILTTTITTTITPTPMDCDAFSLLDLPPLVLVVVLGSLSARDVATASETCNGLYRLCQHNGVWKRVAKRKWGIRPSKGVLRPARWKHYYSQKTVVLREGSFKWESLQPQGDVISKRYQHTGSAVGSDVYFIGGQELPEKRFDEIFVLHTDTMKVEKVNPVLGIPPKFARHTAVTIGDKIYLFGGFDGVSKHFHLSVFDTKSTEWTSPKPLGSTPPSRTNHSAVAVGTRMYIFGGMYKDSSAGSDKLIFLNDMYALETDGPLRWERIQQRGNAPTPRCGHRMVVFGNMLVLFGGGCGEQWDSKFSDVYVFDTTTNEWTKPKITGQAPVCTFTVTFAAGVFLFVFGGQSLHDNNLTNELYCLDTVSLTWSNLSTTGVKPKERDMASGNVVDNSMYMFGGYCGTAIDNLFRLQMDKEIAETPAAPSLFPRA